MEPGAQRVSNPERAGLPDQGQEGGLEGILDIIRIAEIIPADAEDHRPVPLDQGCEGQLGRLGVLGREPFEELTVGELPDGPQVEQGSELPPDGPVRSDRNEFTPPSSPLVPVPSNMVMPLGAPTDRSFPENTGFESHRCVTCVGPEYVSVRPNQETLSPSWPRA